MGQPPAGDLLAPSCQPRLEFKWGHIRRIQKSRPQELFVALCRQSQDTGRRRLDVQMAQPLRKRRVGDTTRIAKVSRLAPTSGDATDIGPSAKDFLSEQGFINRDTVAVCEAAG